MHSHEYKLTTRNNSRKINTSPQSLCKLMSSYIRFFELEFRDVCYYLEFVGVCTYLCMHTFSYICMHKYIKSIIMTLAYGNTHMHIHVQSQSDPSDVRERQLYHENLYAVCEFQQTLLHSNESDGCSVTGSVTPHTGKKSDRIFKYMYLKVVPRFRVYYVCLQTIARGCLRCRTVFSGVFRYVKLR